MRVCCVERALVCYIITTILRVNLDSLVLVCFLYLAVHSDEKRSTIKLTNMSLPQSTPYLIS
jgi:hypothetical protein